MLEAEAEDAARRGEPWDSSLSLPSCSALPEAGFWRDWLLSRRLPAAERFLWQQRLAQSPSELLEPEEFLPGRLPPPPGREALELTTWKRLALARFLHHQSLSSSPLTAALHCVWLGRILEFSWRSPQRVLFLDFSDRTLMNFCASLVANPPPTPAETCRARQALAAAAAGVAFFSQQGQIRPEHAALWQRMIGHLESQVLLWKPVP